MRRREPMRRSAIKRAGVGRREPKDKEAAALFREGVIAAAKGRCARCWQRTRRLDAHHICPRARASGSSEIHNSQKNGAAPCRVCHDEIHTQAPEDLAAWIKPLRWLEAGGLLAPNEGREDD